ncbi:MAG: hypothetical protein IPJ30_13075 [Acidobacteria bacterium]|nr:hypothetical protein [Acidobacteriota bacterium]
MNFFLNELSVHNQFNSVDEFRSAIKDLVISCRKITEYRFPVLTHFNFSHQAAMHGKTIMSAVYSLRPEERGLYISVLDRIRRWSIEPCLQRPEDTFLVHGRNVTGSSIAEAACYRSLDDDAKLLSLTPSEWNASPLNVLTESGREEKESILVENCFDSVTVSSVLLLSEAFPTSWEELQDRCIGRFNRLQFCDNSFDSLMTYPYRLAVAKKHIESNRIVERTGGLL